MRGIARELEHTFSLEPIFPLSQTLCSLSTEPYDPSPLRLRTMHPFPKTRSAPLQTLRTPSPSPRPQVPSTCTRAPLRRSRRMILSDTAAGLHVTFANLGHFAQGHEVCHLGCCSSRVCRPVRAASLPPWVLLQLRVCKIPRRFVAWVIFVGGGFHGKFQ